MNLLGCPPARFRRERVLIIGCGDIGQRVARLMGSGQRAHLLALTSSPERCASLRAQGITPLIGNLDDRQSLQRLAGVATRILHLAPPASINATTRLDYRTRALLHALAHRHAPLAFVYGSTTGVYGDKQGQWTSETAPATPQTDRAWRRRDAERQIHEFGRIHRTRTTVLRIPGIYATDRPGGHPRRRLEQGTPVLQEQHDVYTNHIHADDLALACVLALWRGRAQRNINVTDDTDLKMGTYFDLIASIYNLPPPPRISPEQAARELPPMLLSFMSESRRLKNQRLKKELRLRLTYPTVGQGL